MEISVVAVAGKNGERRGPAVVGRGFASPLLLSHWENEWRQWEGGGPHCMPRGAETEVSALPLGRETDFYGFS